MHYYGDRSCNCHPSEDIGIKYFSSSRLKLFIRDQKNNPQDYKYKVVKIFETSREDAKQLECDLHKKFNVKKHSSFINRANQTLDGFGITGNGRPKGSKVSQHSIDKMARTLSINFDKTKHNTSKHINIYNKNGEIMYETFGDFKKVCVGNKLPLYALLSSYRNGSKPIYTTLGDQTTKIKNLGFLDYIGWYAVKLD